LRQSSSRRFSGMISCFVSSPLYSRPDFFL
jgi:hypothetical protein